MIGNGITYSNADISSFNCAGGYFDGSNSNIGFNSGVVLATGSVAATEPGNGSSGGSIFNADSDVISY